MSLSKYHRQRIMSRYNDAFVRNGYHPNALLWSSKEIQQLRFAQLLKIGMKTGDSLLDIGCGFGDFSAYLEQQNITVDFTGIDLVEVFLIEGRRHYPNITLQQGELFDFNPKEQSFDYLTLSGTLNNKLEDQGKHAYTVIERMWLSCRKGIAFNLLDARHEWTAGRWDLQSFYPEEIIQFSESFSNNIEIIDDYLPNDFTVLLKR